MSYLNRKRWLHRTTLGVAVTAALFAGRAAATVDPKPEPKVIPYLSHGMLTQADADRAAKKSQPVDERTLNVIPYLSHGMLTKADADRVAARARTRNPVEVQGGCAKTEAQTNDEPAVFEPADLEPTPQMWPVPERD